MSWDSRHPVLNGCNHNLVPRVFRLFGQRDNAGKTLGTSKKLNFLIGCSVTVSIVLPQKSCGNKIRCPQSLPGVAPLTKKPEDSGYEIALNQGLRSSRWPKDRRLWERGWSQIRLWRHLCVREIKSMRRKGQRATAEYMCRDQVKLFVFGGISAGDCNSCKLEYCK